jgi:prepilin-type N-terminal cleavage/methylation domain-containing protein
MMTFDRHTQSQRRRAFTLIELLVVVGIVVLLAGLLLPMLYKSYRAASKTRIAADLNTIATALDAYKSDFGDYPRPAASGTGFVVLGKALIGPYDATLDIATFQNPTAPYKAGMAAHSGGVQQIALRDTGNGPGSADWVNFAFTDGANGPGFRVRAQGQVKTPYLPVDKFKRQGLALLDHNGYPIMYFPASPVKINLNQTTGNAGFYVSSQALATPGMGPNDRSLFNFDDNGTLAFSLTSAANPTMNDILARWQAMLGYRTFGNPGVLPPGKQPVSVPFLLWSVGPDGYFGPNDNVNAMAGDANGIDRVVRKTDDVANIPLPQ